MRKEYNIEIAVEDAVEIINEDPRAIDHIFRTGKDDIDFLIQFIINELSFDPSEEKTTKGELERKIESVLREVKDESDPSGEFMERIGEELADISNRDTTKYTIAFPLNITGSGVPTEFTVSEVDIKRIPWDFWSDKYIEPIKESTSSNSGKNNSDNLGSLFEQFIDQLPTRPPDYMKPQPINGRDNTFWETKIEARSRDYAINTLSNSLEILLGKINFSLNYMSFETELSSELGSGSDIWHSGESELKKPTCYIVKHEGNATFYSSSDLVPRQRVSFGSKQDKFEEIYDEIPVDGKMRAEFYNALLMGFRAYQSGITEPEAQSSFLNYWRALESVTFSEDDTKSIEILKRANAVFLDETTSGFTKHIAEIMKTRRNNLVHGGGDSDISSGDAKYLRSLFEGVVMFLIEMEGELSLKDVKFILDNGFKSTESLRQAKEEKTDTIEEEEREVEMIEKIIGEWRED